MLSWLRMVRWSSALALGLMTVDAGAAQRVHEVAKGQTLGGIAQRYSVSLIAVARENGIHQDTVLSVGQKLKIPKSDAGSSPKRKGKVHVVASGQTLGAIARRYNVPIDLLAKANGMRRTDTLRVGREIVIPDAESPVASRSSPSASSTTDGLRGYSVVSGDTLGSIALRLDVSISNLAKANQIEERALLRIGQRLVIPPPSDDSPPAQVHGAITASSAGLKLLDVPGVGPVYFYEPVGPGRLGLKPVLMYLHGRGGNPAQDCQRWAPVARQFGWLVCPSGAGDRDSGRTWNNSWSAGFNVATATLRQLREKYGRRVQLYGNTLIGFSEGAFVAMNVGVRVPRTFNRWLILGASDGYLGARGPNLLSRGRSQLRRVYLLTGELDSVVHETRRAGEWVKQAGIPVKVVTPASLAHELALERQPALYRGALAWLAKG